MRKRERKKLREKEREREKEIEGEKKMRRKRIEFDSIFQQLSSFSKCYSFPGR